MAGYSGTPLVKKLGIKSGFKVAFVNAPRDFARHLDLAANVTINLKTRKPLDFALLFVRVKRKLTVGFPQYAARLTPAGMLWVSWPKKSSGVITDLSETNVRTIGLAAGLVDVKICAVDDVLVRAQVRLSAEGSSQNSAGRVNSKTSPSACLIAPFSLSTETVEKAVNSAAASCENHLNSGSCSILHRRAAFTDVRGARLQARPEAERGFCWLSSSSSDMSIESSLATVSSLSPRPDADFDLADRALWFTRVRKQEIVRG